MSKPDYNTYDVLRAKTIAFRTTRTIINEALKEFDVSFNEWLALHSISRGTDIDTVHATELASELEVSLPYVNKLCNNLVERGLIARATDHTDLRSKTLLVTGRGMQLIKATEQSVKQALGRWLAPIDESQIDTYLGTLLTVAQLPR